MILVIICLILVIPAPYRAPTGPIRTVSLENNISIPVILNRPYRAPQVDVAPEPGLSAGNSTKLEEIGDFYITSYCPCEECCGIWAIDRPGGKVYTASGELATQGISCGVDPKIIPYGTKLYIEGVGIRIAHDTGGKDQGYHIDIYFDTHDQALNGYRFESAKVWKITSTET